MKEKFLSHEYLKELLSYDPETGIFTWKVRKAHRIHIGDVAGSLSNRGYYKIIIDGMVFSNHRLAFFYMTGRWPSDQIDHANGDPKDNRWCNLREATKFQNHMNTIKPSANKSGYKGVKRLENGRFSSCITLYRKRVYLGTFDTIKEAHAAYCGAAKAVFGEFANGGEPK